MTSKALTFTEQELAVLLWLFTAGYDQLGRGQTIHELTALSQLEERVAQLKPDGPFDFEADEVTELGRVFEVGRRSSEAALQAPEMNGTLVVVSAIQRKLGATDRPDRPGSALTAS